MGVSSWVSSTLQNSFNVNGNRNRANGNDCMAAAGALRGAVEDPIQYPAAMNIELFVLGDQPPERPVMEG